MQMIFYQINKSFPSEFSFSKKKNSNWLLQRQHIKRFRISYTIPIIQILQSMKNHVDQELQMQQGSKLEWVNYWYYYGMPSICCACLNLLKTTSNYNQAASQK